MKLATTATVLSLVCMMASAALIVLAAVVAIASAVASILGHPAAYSIAIHSMAAYGIGTGLFFESQRFDRWAVARGRRLGVDWPSLWDSPPPPIAPAEKNHLTNPIS